MATRIFDVSILRLSRLLLPTFLRGGALMHALQQVLAKPLAQLVEQLAGYRAGTAQRMGYSSQACDLQRMLNDRFDIAQRRIAVSTVVPPGAVRVFTASMLRPVRIGQAGAVEPLKVPRQDSVQSFAPYIRVSAPAGTASEAELTAAVREYSLATKDVSV